MRERSASKIEAFLAAETALISLSTSALPVRASIRKLVPQCYCLIVDAETLSNAADAIQTGFTEVCNLTDLAARIFVFGFQPTERHDAILRALSADGLRGVQPLADGDQEFRVAGSHRELCGQFSGLSFGAVNTSRGHSFLQ